MRKIFKNITLILCFLMVLGLFSGCKDNTVSDNPTTGALTMPDYTTEVSGKIARFSDDVVMLITDSYGPIVLGGEMNFEGLNNGDTLTIYCNGVEETYPARAEVVEMILHSRGTVDDLPTDVLDTLSGMGYELVK